MPSYVDQNFRFKLESGGGFVLKVASPQARREGIELEVAAHLWLARKASTSCVQCPEVRPTFDEKYVVSLPTASGPRIVRMLSYLEGETYANLAPRLDLRRRRNLAHSLGTAVGALLVGLADFERLPIEQTHDWNLLSLPRLLAEADRHTVEPGLLRLLNKMAGPCVEHLVRLQGQLPMQMIHNDANDHNVIVNSRSGSVRGVIDFGDMCYSLRVAEVAVACTYAMQHDVDPIVSARQVLRGCLSQCELLREEIQVLPSLIAARLCQSILMAARAHAADPRNDYILISQTGVRALLHEFESLDLVALGRSLATGTR